MREYAIGYIGTSKQSLEHAAAVARRMNQELLLELAGLEDALAPGMRMVERDKVEIIISLRGTANLLRQRLPVPVLALPSNALNLVAAVRKASGISRRVLLSLYATEQQMQVGLLEDIFRISVRKGIYTDTTSLESVILEGKSAGCGVVVGGGTSVKLAEKHGLPYVLVAPSDEAIALTLDNAVNIARTKRQEHELLERHRTILNAVSDGIIAVDGEGRLTVVNRQARQIYRLEDNVLGRAVAQVLPDSPLPEVIRSRSPRLNELKKVGEERYVVSTLPVCSGEDLLGGVCTLQLASSVMKAEKAVHREAAAGHVAKYRLEDYRHRDADMSRVLGKLRQYAACDSTVLITGETGTGKEILAHGVHLASRRRNGPFVSVNCSALPEALLESELFGYEGGAFTGSRREGKPGLFELAHRGTLFLDEISSMPSSVQSLLLRVLQEKEVRRVGGGALIPVNVRIVAATNRQLADEVRNGHLREDLFFRLNVLTVELPPLRRRPDDVPLLVVEFVRRTASRNGREAFGVPADCMALLCGLPWPGNARELEHFVERLVVLSPGGFDRAVFDELYREVASYSFGRDLPKEGGQKAPQPSLLTRERIEEALRETGYRKARAAQLLGVSRTTLWRMMSQLGICGRAGSTLLRRSG